MTAAAAALEVGSSSHSRSHGPSDFDRCIRNSYAKRRVKSCGGDRKTGSLLLASKTIAALAAGKKLPSIGSKEYAEAGGLIGYGVNILSLYRRAAYFIDKILKGGKPADLPIEQPTRFDFMINVKAAKALGFTVPPAVLALPTR